MEPLVVRTRAKRVESIHNGYICIIDTSRNILYNLGDPDTEVYIRSAAKPFQAIPLVESGAMEKYDITLKELAIICGSHSGEDYHLETVSSILRKIGLNEKFLRCGSAYPYNTEKKELLIQRQERPSPLYNTCSGKHAGMLALCKFFDYPLEGYTREEHPVQQLIIKVLAELLDINEKDIILGIDGCDIPNYMISIKQAAYLYALLAAGNNRPSRYGDSLELISRAMTTYPGMVNGSGEFCTELMFYTKGKITSKMGAEGIYGVAVPEKGIGIFIKIADGAEEALYPTTVSTLKQLEVLDKDMQEKLSNWIYPPVKNHRGRIVGYSYPIFDISRSYDNNIKIGDYFELQQVAATGGK